MGSPLALKAHRRPARKKGDSCRHGDRTRTRLTMGVKPSFSANPRQGFSIPALPSETTQHVTWLLSNIRLLSPLFQPKLTRME